MRSIKKNRASCAVLLAAGLGAGCGEENPLEPREESATLSGAEGDALEVTREAPGEIRLGERFRYTIRVRNQADEPLRGVVLEDRPPRGFELLRASFRAGEDALPQQRTPDAQRREGEGPKLRFEIGTLAPDEEAVLEIDGVAHEEGQSEACSVVSYDAPVCTSWKVVDPELRAEVEVAGDDFWICEGIPVALRVANRGTGTVESGEIRADLPEGLRTEDGERELVLEFDPIGAGESIEEEVALWAERAGNFEVRASAETPTLSVQSQSRSFRVLDPRIELTVDAPEPLPLGATRRLPVRVSNTGVDPAEGLEIEIEDAENTRAALYARDGSDGADELELGKLGPGDSTELQLALRPREVGELRVRLVAKGRCLEDEGRSAEALVAATVVGVPAVRLEVVDEKDPVSVGETTAYRIEVKNQGTAQDLRVSVLLALPPQLEHVATEGGGQGRGAPTLETDGTLRLGPVERLDPGESVGWRVAARAVAAGKGLLRLRLSSEATSGPVVEEESTTVLE